MRLQATPGRQLQGTRVAGPQRWLEWFLAIAPDAETVPKIHSLALRLARVAQGELDIAFAVGNSHDWDLAAADLIVHEAAGALTGLDGRPLAYNRSDLVHAPLMAAGIARHEVLIARVRDHPPRL